MPPRHQRLALHIVLDRIDAVERDHGAVLEIDDREAAGRRVAAQHRRVMPDRQAHRLQLEIELVGPEPGHRLIRLRIAGDRLGDGPGHVVGVLDGFHADRRAVGKAVGMGGAITDRIDVRQAGAAMRIDLDTVADPRARSLQGCHGRHDADADDHDVGRQRLPIG